MSRGFERDHTAVALPLGGRILVPTCVAWVQCACGDCVAKILVGQVP